MKLSALLAPLLDAKVDHEMIRKMVLAYEQEQIDALAQRRQADADRQARKRERDKSRDITLRHSDRSLTGAGDAPVEDKTSNSEIEPLKKERLARGTRLPENWSLPGEWSEWAIKRGLPQARIPIEAEKLRNWAANAGSKGVKRDWFKAWQNWVIGAIDQLPQNRAPPQQAKAPQLADVFAFIGKQAANGQQEREDSGGLRPTLPHLPAVGSGR